MRSAASPLCATPKCRNKKLKGRNYCCTCRSRRNRERNPVTAAYHNLKNRARQRGKVFEITPAEFAKFCADTDYIRLKGKHKDAMSIDRREENGPYAIWNIQLLTLSQNTSKMLDHRTREMIPNWDPSAPYTEDERPW